MKRSLSLLFILILGAATTVAQKKAIEFENLFDNTFSERRISNVRWMNDGKYYSESRGMKIIRNNITREDEQSVLFDGANFSNTAHQDGIYVQGYQFSADENKIMIQTDVERIWRRSTRANYYVYDRLTESLTKLTNTEGKQQYAELSPEGDKAAFVRDNNLFWVDLASGEEKQITEDGEINAIINGAADWVYEEEFGFAKAWFWSPDGNRIAFYRFDEREVPEFYFTSWGDLYPDKVEYKYPKAGETNSIVQIHVYDLQTGETTMMDIGEETDQYIPRINWTTNSNTLAIRRMNRLQNKQDLMLADVSTGETRIILTEENPNGWIDVHDNLLFLSNGEQFLYTSEKDGYNHIYLYSMEGEELTQITKGEWEVSSFIGHDERRHMLYYTTTEESSMERHFYTTRIDGRRTSKLSEGAGMHSINMSKDFEYYIDVHSSFSQPTVYKLYNRKGKELRVLEDNAALAQTIDEYAFMPKEFMQLDINGASLNAYMIKPVDFDSTQKYPVLMFVYGGPGSQTVMNSWEGGIRGLWHQMLANKGYIIVSVDNRGTGGKGRDFKQVTYKQLGVLEPQDQAEAARYIAQLEYVDENRIGIWGWSYGGFMSTLTLEEGSDIISTAIAVAPVTSWRYYDTIYTERYMQTPQLNPEGYDSGSPITRAEEIKGNYLLIHGTGDDNVHYQNAVEMVDALIAAGVQFETMYYPNRNHGIYGGNTRNHLYRLLTDYILENL